MSKNPVMFLKRYPYWFICLLLIVLVGFYWGVWASDRYVSETNVVLESPQIAPPELSFQSLMGAPGGNAGDMLLLRDYLLSVDMLRKADAALNLREHYAQKDIDVFSRLASVTEPTEEFHRYYQKRVSVELDDYAGILRINVTAFNPQIAHDLAQFLLREGEQHMNSMGQRLAEEQVAFLEKQVAKQAEQFDAAREALINYQNENGLVSPTGTVESLNSVVANLEGELAKLRAKKTALLSYQSQRSAEVQRVDAEINALIQQISRERARMAQQSGGALNVLSSRYQELELTLQFAQESYAGALMALENTRIEAARKLKQVSVLQSPTMPEYSVEPRRLYNTVVFAIIAFLAGLIVQMLVLIVKDHKD
ncbi:MAG: capsular polysaccharide transport system permease protein [Marinobacter sp. T13-3]|nr:MAG: capsular polysaccharide transport system permease protein [Marinobacter sp. T13-3]